MHAVVEGMAEEVAGDGEAVVPKRRVVVVVEGVNPLLGADGVGIDLITGAGPIEG